MAYQEIYDELCYYTLSRGDSAFVHQHVVDAWAAQNADESTKPIRLTFALVGLYLHVDKQFDGRQVQRAHTLLAQRKKRPWPTFSLPRKRGSMTAKDVMAAPEGNERDRAIRRWCIEVWDAFRESQNAVAELAAEYEIV